MKKLLLIIPLILALILPTEANALFFPGASFVTSPVNLGTEPTTALTFMAWVYSTSTTATQFIGGRSTTTTVASPYVVRIQTGTAIRFSLKTTGAETALTTAASTWMPNRWSHVTATYDGANMRVYINGTLSSSVAKTGALLGNGVVTTPMTIGRFLNSTTLPCGGCWISDVRVYNRALSATEIKNIYYTGNASRVGLAHHLPLWSIPIVNFASPLRMGSTTGSGIFQSRLPNFAKYKK